MVTRRTLLKGLAALGAGAVSPLRAQVVSALRFASDPFTLGVASGVPHPGGFVIWTRLAPLPAAPGGGLPPDTYPVEWEVARDEAMRDVAARGTAYASAQWAHSVHVELAGLQPARPYWYRFRAGEAQSPVGRALTAPGPSARPARLRFAFASCQHYEQGYFGAYRHMAADAPDFVAHLGDYIYESSWGRDHVRKHGSPEPITLEDYRARHALYRSDPDLQLAHATAPWLVTWDDHEVDNDYAAERSENADPVEWFLARRAAAYQAWYEHMPVPRSMVPLGPHARITTRVAYGDLLSVFVLDDRQYRAPQSCPRPGRAGSNTVDVAECPELADPRRSLLGEAQEKWLEAGLAASRSRWNLLAQQTLMAQFDQKPGPGRMAWTDGWDGYPAARRRLLDFIAERKVANPVVIGGDVHSFNVAELRRDFDDPRSPVVASEFVGTSITSQAWPQERLAQFLPDNPHVLLADSRYRGYVRVDLTRERWTADLRAMQNVQSREAPCQTLATFVVENGRPGPQRA